MRATTSDIRIASAPRIYGAVALDDDAPYSTVAGSWRSSRTSVSINVRTVVHSWVQTPARRQPSMSSA